VQREQLARVVALGALAIGVIAVIMVLLGSGSSYVLHADFSDAGQLVKDDLVTVAGHQVGSIGAIKLTANGLADVELDISDQSITPIRSGTIARIGQLSLTGVANRFVGLELSNAGSPIKSGGSLPATQTRGIVDLDILLDALTPRVRASLQQILKTGAYLVRNPTDKEFNQAIPYFNPAFSQTAELGAEIVSDKFALQRLVSSSADVATGLAAHSADLGGAVASTAATLREIASERSALSDAISRAPGVLKQTTAVMRDTDYALHVLNPTLVDLRPVVPRLARLLTVLLPAARNAIPLINGLEALVPSAKKALRGLPPVEHKATPAVQSLTAALTKVTPILAGLRPYTPDVVAGFFNGVGGATGGTYDANGHYLKYLLSLQGGGQTLSGVLNLLGGVTGSLGPFNGGRTHLLATCPGGGGPPAPDASNPWNSPDVLPGTGNVCNPADNQK
jgi:phospholipid/cholesterol/gamma-HCH transport system substrate-binding protein